MYELTDNFTKQMGIVATVKANSINTAYFSEYLENFQAVAKAMSGLSQASRAVCFVTRVNG